jgi:hypothetical protein
MGWCGRRRWKGRSGGRLRGRQSWTQSRCCAHLKRMSSGILYSTNPWFASDIAMRYRGGVHFAWVCEHFDARMAPHGSAGSLIAPSSNPCEIYRNLRGDFERQDTHSALIKGYKKKFTRLARDWLSDGSLTSDQHDEIIAAVRGWTWTIWHPVLYVIPREPLEKASRVVSVPRPDRAAHGPELQITALKRDEFDIIELNIR